MDRSLDGKNHFQARYDAAGRLIELQIEAVNIHGTADGFERSLGPGLTRWTYEGCGR
jgi:hypothetical protein